MTHDPHSAGRDHSVEMPRSTAAPIALATGLTLMAMGLATSLAFLPIGAIVFVAALARWIDQLLPGRGHAHEPFVDPSLRPRPVEPSAIGVEELEHGKPGYRLRLPVRVHPVSAGVKGGIVGGIVMPIPALAYGYFSGHGLWWPVNLLAGLVLPGVGSMTQEQLGQLNTTLLVTGIAIHIVVSLVMGLMYGVLLPTLPNLPKPLAWGALLMPLAWTAVSYVALGRVNPELRSGIEWPWFVLSQFVFGVVAALVFMRFASRSSLLAGLFGGFAGGLLMPIPAILWSVVAGHGIWYPVNLLAAMSRHYEAVPSIAELEAFHGDWFVAALGVHAILSLVFGLAFALVLPPLPKIPGPMAWGGMLLPLLWTAMSYGMMGVVNPVLQEYVDWPWYIASQFVFGIVASIVVVQSEQVYIPPAGKGPDARSEYVAN
jgi:hypothetical protein